jgi:transposase
MDRQTLRDWVHRYNEAGVEGLRTRPIPGRTPFLTEPQMAELVVEGPTWQPTKSCAGGVSTC